MSSFLNENDTNMNQQQSANNQQSVDSRKFLLNKIKSSDNCLISTNSSSTSKINNIKKQQSNNELVSNSIGLSSSGQSSATIVVPNPIKLNSAMSFHTANEIEEEAKMSSVRVESEVEHNKRSQMAIDAKSAKADNQNESDAINQSLSNKLIINNESKRSAFRPFKSKKQSSRHLNEANELSKAFELSSTSSAASSSSATDKKQSKTLTSTENSSESKEIVEVEVEDEDEEVDENDSATEGNSENKKHNTKRSAFAWVGKKMAK
jgi:hypothetical protein